MKKLTKISLVAVMAVISFVAGAMGITSIKVSKANEEIKGIINDFDFGMQSNVQILVDLTENGYSSENIGLRFIAKADKDDYESLKANENLSVKFGMAVIPFDITNGQLINGENLLFKDNGVYFAGANGETKVKTLETSNLTAYVVNDEINYYYMTLSMDNSMINVKDEQFVAVPFVKAIKDDVTVYQVKNDENVVYSPAFAAQLFLEKGLFTDEDALSAVQTAYVDGVTDIIEINYTVSYGGKFGETLSKECTFNIGETFTAEDILAKMDSFDVVDKTLFSDGNVSITVNGDEKETVTVYANGKTNALVNVSFDALEADDAVYEEFKGYFITDKGASLNFNSDKTVTVNADFAYSSEKSVANYVLYLDGTIKVVLSDEKVALGTYDLENKSATLFVEDNIINYSASVELSNKVYDKVSGVYTDGENTFVLSPDGTITKNLIKSGNYFLCYDAKEEKLIIKATILSDKTYSSELSFVDDAYIFDFDGAEVSQESNKTLAPKSAYKNIANTYKGSFYLPKADNTLTTTLPFDAMITLNEDGSLIYKGVDAYSPNASFNNDWTAIGLLQDVKNGRFNLFTDGTMKLYIPQIAKRLSKTDFGVLDVVLSGTYSEKDGTITLDLSEYKNYRTTEVYTAVSNSNSNTQDLYEAFAGTYAGGFSFDKDGFVTKYDLSSYTLTDKSVYESEEEFTVSNGQKGDNKKEWTLTSILYKRNGAHPVETGTYTLQDGVITLEFTDKVIEGTFDNGEFTVNNETFKKVNVDVLYDDLVKTTYKDANNYSNVALSFTKNDATYFGGYAGRGGAQNWTFDYTIIPITETFGKIQATMTDKTQSSDGIFFYDFGHSVAEIYYVYDALNGSFNLRVSSGVNASRGLKPTYNHFTDYTADGALVTDAKYTALSNTYTDGVNTLVLSGLDTIGSGFKGGKGTLNGNNITYSIIAISSNSGKIFFDMTDSPSSYAAREDKTTFVIGDYQMLNGKFVVSFTYADQSYVLAEGGFDKLVMSALSGTYTGTVKEFTLFADGSATFDGKVASYSVNADTVNSGTIEINVNGDIISGSFNTANGNKIYLSDSVYIKKFMSEEELYAKYAGEYNASYTVNVNINFKNTIVNNTMKLVLKEDGTFVGTGTSDKADDTRSCHGNTITILNKHLGSTERKGTYSFEVIDGVINIVLKFDIYNGDLKLTHGGSEKTYKVNHLSGYYSGIKYASYWGKADTNYGLPTGEGTAVYNVYTYACGTVSENTLSVLFSAFSDTPITLTKVN